ncbi:hypothetical protein OK349_16255 [Sphingomonas sp. BT-65]|uniref:hypothetical protein n=1 Tax=Sphingomonas sp. BT-65 TaxID=2989821 RepID=UPI0022368857|nr:hypothetical protein [Sphingomonas sp. BT-65]MCW4463267.1 hypothetical protein [Sphingomonas sp. BT-65]
MLALLLLLAVPQAFAMTPLPAEMEPHLERYGRCLQDAMESRQAELHPDSQPSRAAALFGQARASCAQVRSEAIEGSLKGLASNVAFADAAKRKAFVIERFDGAEALLKASYAGEFDPDKW